MAIDWTKIYQKYKGLWIALTDDEKTVVGKGTTAREALEDARAQGFPNPVLTRMPEQLVTYVGFGV